MQAEFDHLRMLIIGNSFWDGEVWIGLCDREQSGARNHAACDLKTIISFRSTVEDTDL